MPDKPVETNPTVSIVDDDELLRAVTCSLIRSLGLTAYGFASAEEFFRSPRLTATLCLISDVQMPSMSGIELQSALISQGYRNSYHLLYGVSR